MSPCPIPKLAEIHDYLQSLDARADLQILSRLLSQLDLTREDLDPVLKFGDRGYKRNTISRSHWYELLALCWRSGQCSPIHDHQGSSCAFRVVHGIGTEIRFNRTESGLICPVGAVRMDPGYVCAAEDADIHEVANMQPPGNDLITLHIYSPALASMNTYSLTSPKVVAEPTESIAH